MTEPATEPESFGEMILPDGTIEKIVALFTVYRDDREATCCETDAGTIVVVTKSWLRQNDRELVQTVHAYTPQTFAIMLEAMLLGVDYLGIDLAKQSALLHAGDENQVHYEFAGRGEPTFQKKPEQV